MRTMVISVWVGVAVAATAGASACAQTQLLEAPAPLASDGGAGTDATLGEDAAPGEPELVAKGISGALDIAVDDKYVYLASMDAQSAFAVPKAGGEPILLGQHSSAVLGITVDAARVYWGVAGVTNDSSAPGLIVSVPVANLGAKPQTFKTSTTFSAFSPWSLASDATHVYCGSANGVFAADKESRAEIALGGGQIPTPLVLTNDSVYWVARLDGAILGSAKTGGGASTIVKGAPQAITGLAADEERVYWLESDGPRGRVFSIPRSGGAKTELASIGQSGYGMTVDAKYIYWTILAGGSVNRVPKAGGAAELLAVNVVAPSLKGGAITQDATHVYWTTGEGNVFRLRK